METQTLNLIEGLKFISDDSKRKILYLTADSGRYYSQELYRLYLEKSKDDIALAEKALKEVMGEKLYDFFNDVLEEQRKQRIDEIQRTKPKLLWRTTSAKVNMFEPRWNSTMYNEFAGNYVFATSSLNKSLTYAIYGSSGTYMAGYAPQKLFCILKDREKTLNLMKANPRYRYSVPSDSFMPVVSKDGSFDGEWISEQPIEVSQLKAEPLGIEDVLKAGIQVFFVKDPKNYDKVIHVIEGQRFGGQKLSELGRMAAEGMLIHENKDRDIRPVEFETETRIAFSI